MPAVELDRPAARAAAAGPALAPSARRSKRAMRQALDGGGQVILLLNRRGFSHARPLPGVRPRRAVPALRPGADVPPQRRRRCSATTAAPSSRPSSTARRAASRRSATRGSAPRSWRPRSRRSSPTTSCQRMDSDTMTRPGSHEQVLDAFRDGHDPHPARHADDRQGARLPQRDAGRRGERRRRPAPARLPRGRADVPAAGPGGRPGRPRRRAAARCWCRPSRRSTRASRLAATHDYADVRRAGAGPPQGSTSYPPYQRLARLIVRSQNEEAARDVRRHAGRRRSARR